MTRDDLLRKWVAALESGEYHQGVGALRLGNSYCCLGVLCDVSGEGRWMPPENGAIIAKDRWVTKDGWDVNALPYTLADHVNLTAAEEQELVAANDNGVTFPQIAQRIRAMFPDVFSEAAIT